MRRLGLFLRKYRTIGAVSLRNRLIYLGNFAGSMLTYALFIYIFSRIWATALGSGPSGAGGAGAAEVAAGGRIAGGRIAGYDRAMLVWYFIVAEISSFGFGRFFGTLSPDIRSGQVAYLLARPYSFVGYQYAERMGPALVEAAILLAEGLLLGLLLGGPLPIASLGQAAALLLSLFLAGSLQFFLQTSIAMTAFWFEENSAFFWIYQKLSLVVGTLLPLEFLPEGAAKAALWTPFPFLAYAPARIAVAFEPGEALGLLGAQACWLALAAGLARAVFGRGASKISAQGG